MSVIISEYLCTIGILLVIIPSTLSEDVSLDVVIKSCDDKLNFKSISQFKVFMEHYTKVVEDNSLTGINNNKLLSRCLEEKDSIIALKNLVLSYDKKRPCKWQEISKLENYAETFLLNSKKRPLTLKFYTLFGVQVGFMCKMNLLAHINQADNEVDQVDFIYSLASPLGWNVLVNEYTKKAMKFGSSTSAEESLINRIAKLIPGLIRVEQLDYMNFNHIQNNIMIKDSQGVERSFYKCQNQELKQLLLKWISKVVSSCQNLDQFYYNSTLSLARLKSLGLLQNFDVFNNQHEHSLMLHKWLAATSFCQLMVRVKVINLEEDDTKLAIDLIHKDSLIESRRKLYSYVAEFDDIGKEAVENVWSASVLEGDWCRKDKATFKQHDGAEPESVPMKRLKQFIRGLEKDHLASLDRKE